MIIFCNNRGEIKDVSENSKKDFTLKEIEIDDSDNPFLNWSNAKICCYKCTVIGGKVTMMTPYVDSRLIEHIDDLGRQAEENLENLISTQDALMETFTEVASNTETLENCQDALMELYTLALGEEETEEEEV